MPTPRIVPLGQYIIERGWTQAEFARLIGIRQAAVSEIASGRRWPRRETRKALCRALGVKNDELIDMLALSHELVAIDDPDQQRFGRHAGRLCHLASSIDRPCRAVAGIASSARRVLLAMMRRRKVTIVIQRPGS